MPKDKPYQLWGGRFSSKPDDRVAAFSRSLGWEWRLFPYDLVVNRAHGRMLKGIGVFSEEEWSAIETAIDQLESAWQRGELKPAAAVEDVHTFVEASLVERVGEAAKRIHTGRSRNDQVVTDVRLWLRDAVDHLLELLSELISAVAVTAEREIDLILPGYTHLQRAQPVRLAHHLLAWAEMLLRDSQRLADARRRINRSPLGAAALAGSSFPLDRHTVAEELGFDGLLENSIDAVADRDFVLEAMSAFAILGNHLSRIAEEYVLWSSSEFGYVTLPEEYCTGSSALPHKRNPDVAELVRGKSARLTGNLVTLLTLVKALPLAYNRDLQEDKQPLFDSADTLFATLELMPGMVERSTYHAEVMRQAAESGHWQAMYLAELLTREGVPFREAHERIGTLVQKAESAGCSVGELEDKAFAEVVPELDSETVRGLTLETVVDTILTRGGTGKRQVLAALGRIQQELQKSV